MGQGRNSFIGWAQESPWGTPAAPSKYAELLPGESLETIRRRTPRPVVRGLHHREGNLYDELFGGAGAFPVELNYGGMLRLWEHLFGDASVATVETEAGIRLTHTITLKPTVMSGKGLSVHVNRDTDAGSTPQARLAGFKLNRATLSFDPTRNAMVEFEGAAKDVSLVAVSTPTFPSTSLYVAGHQCTVEIDDVVRAVDSVELTIDNGLDLEKRVLGSKNIAEPIRSDEPQVISGVVRVDALQADWSKLDAGTLFKLEVLNAGPTLGAGTYRFDLTALKCLVVGNPFTVQGPGQLKTELAFDVLEPTAGEMLSLVIVNNESTVA